MQTHSTSSPTAEFSRAVHLSELAGGTQTLTLAATPEECRALAARYGIAGIIELTAAARLRLQGDGGVDAELSFAAKVQQESVVSLQPVASLVEERWRVRYLPEAEMEAAQDRTDGYDVDLEETDIEPIIGDSFDIGETVAQQLSLALDPYPRAEGESLENVWRAGEDEAESAPAGPFAILKKLKQNT